MQITTLTPFIGFVDSRQGGRTENQDMCGYADTPFGLLMVICDGMGGGPSGKYASSVTVDIIIQIVRNYDQSVDRSDILQNAIKMANHTLLQKIQEKPALKGMGTTVTALLINEYSAIIAHAGDSRIYQFRRGNKIYRTFDHSMVFELVKNGTLSEEQARMSAQSNIITRALGTEKNIEAEIKELPYEKGDRFMLCTDGIWNVLQEKELIKIAAGTKSPGGAVESLVIRVDEQGFSDGGVHDNLTVALIQTTKNSILKEKMSTKMKKLLFALITICCLSIIGNLVLLVHTLKPSGFKDERMESANIDSLQRVWTQDIRTEFEVKLKESEQKQKKTMDSLSKMMDKSPDKVKEYVEVIKNQYTVIEKLNEIINNLQKLRDMPESEAETKDKMLKDIVSLIQEVEPELESEYKISDYEFHGKKKDGKEYGIILLLKQNIAKESTDRSKGHYDKIIKRLDIIKDKINQ